MAPGGALGCAVASCLDVAPVEVARASTVARASAPRGPAAGRSSFYIDCDLFGVTPDSQLVAGRQLTKDERTAQRLNEFQRLLHRPEMFLEGLNSLPASKNSLKEAAKSCAENERCVAVCHSGSPTARPNTFLFLGKLSKGFGTASAEKPGPWTCLALRGEQPPGASDPDLTNECFRSLREDSHGVWRPGMVLKTAVELPRTKQGLQGIMDLLQAEGTKPRSAINTPKPPDMQKLSKIPKAGQPTAVAGVPTDMVAGDMVDQINSSIPQVPSVPPVPTQVTGAMSGADEMRTWQGREARRVRELAPVIETSMEGAKEHCARDETCEAVCHNAVTGRVLIYSNVERARRALATVMRDDASWGRLLQPATALPWDKDEGHADAWACMSLPPDCRKGSVEHAEASRVSIRARRQAATDEYNEFRRQLLMLPKGPYSMQRLGPPLGFDSFGKALQQPLGWKVLDSRMKFWDKECKLVNMALSKAQRTSRTIPQCKGSPAMFVRQWPGHWLKCCGPACTYLIERPQKDCTGCEGEEVCLNNGFCLDPGLPGVSASRSGAVYYQSAVPVEPALHAALTAVVCRSTSGLPAVARRRRRPCESLRPFL